MIRREATILIDQLITDITENDWFCQQASGESSMEEWEKNTIVQALKHWRDVKENRTTEPVDISDKLPCEWCDGKEKDICRTGNPSAYLEEDSGDWYLTFVLSDYHSMLDDSVEINYCPNCGRKLK